MQDTATTHTIRVSVLRFAVLLAAVAAGNSAEAAEIRLRKTCQCARALVTLGDVADIYSVDQAEQQRLAGVELMPAPAPGSVRYLRAREIHDLLHDRGLNTAGHRLSGASVVTVSAKQAEVQQVAATKPLPVVRATSDVSLANAKRRATQAVRTYLQSNARADAAWRVELTLNSEHLATLADAVGKLEVRGGQAPWVGQQQFTLRIDTGRNVLELPARALVTLPESVVVAARSLPRGALVQAADLRLEPGKDFHTAGSVQENYYDVEEVVGQETTRAIAPGQIVHQDYVRQPRLVQRGDVVTVVARSSGIRVRTTARAREDGAQGDLISVESLLDRTRYFARVSGIQEVEVYAASTSVAPQRDAARR